MAEESSRATAREPLLAAWIKWTMDFWETMAQMGPGPAEAVKSGGAAPEEAPRDQSWLSTLNLWQAFFALLTEPGTVAAVFRGIKAPSEIILKMAQAGWEGYFHLHQQWLEGWQGEEPQKGNLDFENLDQDIFKICNEIYEHDFGQILNLPSLRLTCLPQERINQAVDNFTHFQGAMAEFIYLLFLPVKKSLRVMGEEWRQPGAEKPPEDFKEYYKKWLKILEGHYMTLFQSPEYTRTLSHTLEALEDFAVAKQALIADAMGTLSLPTQREVDELYREMHLVKKSMREMAKQQGQSGPLPEED